MVCYVTPTQILTARGAAVSAPALPSPAAGWPPESDAGRGRRWLAAAGIGLMLASVLPPVGPLALRYVLAESLQFVVLAVAGPALVVLGAPWRLLRLSGIPAAAGPLDRLAAGRREHRSFLRSGGYLLVFMTVTVAWRLPPVMDALPGRPLLLAAEAVTVLPAGLALWLELVPSPPLSPRLPHPHRAAVAALAMWCTWVGAYVIGLSNTVVFRGYASLPDRAVSPAADQEIAVAIVWAVAGLCFVPFVIATMASWLSRAGDPDEELQRLVRDSDQRAVVRGWGTQPRKRRG
jgi:cytochrome c oxidase assembly factor CtaG